MRRSALTQESQGSHILSALATHPEITSIYAYSRKPLNLGNPKVQPITSPNSDTWPTHYPTDATIFFSALGTTARAAGGFANQRKIDYDLNIELAQAARRAGATVYVLISTSGASTSSIFPYTRMKGELDEAVKGIGFKHTIILKPGLLVGTRSDSRPGEFAARRVAALLGRLSGGWLKDGWAQDADVVARAAVGAALEAVKGENNDAVRVLGQREIVPMGSNSR